MIKVQQRESFWTWKQTGFTFYTTPPEENVEMMRNSFNNWIKKYGSTLPRNGAERGYIIYLLKSGQKNRLNIATGQLISGEINNE
jgi:hypothetical protein